MKRFDDIDRSTDAVSLRARYAVAGAMRFAGGKALRMLALAAMLLPVAACSTVESFSSLNPFASPKYKTKIEPDVPAQGTYDQGLARMAKRDYGGAAKKFEELEKQHPFTQWSRKGLLMSTYAYYEGGKYDEASASALRYVNLYPSTKETPYAMYLVGMSLYNQIPDITRDQEYAERSIIVFNQLIEKYPKSEYVEDAKYKVTVAKDQLAGKEMSVGRFYLKRKNFGGAINRFRNVLAKYQTTRHVEEALYRLVEAYLGLGIVHEAQTAAAVLGHNYPDSQWYKDAYALLTGRGLQPKRSPGSWVARLFPFGGNNRG
ncbi:MAG: outer membrane protein assembly factor BamD [Beijerinckiaceae bacterium]|jgi:outer membrane protein assembly factor BamD|nr:outer membrane protein assembly factor BamD [Beijerinckiaceae bacterium]